MAIGRRRATKHYFLMMQPGFIYLRMLLKASGSNTCMFTKIVHTFFQSVWRVRYCVHALMMLAMGGHIGEKWYEFTTGEPEIDRYG